MRFCLLCILVACADHGSAMPPPGDAIACGDECCSLATGEGRPCL